MKNKKNKQEPSANTDAAARTDDTAAVGAAEKPSDPNVRMAAYLMLIPALLALLSSLWMASRTLGTNLLFITASRGQFYRSYPIFFCLGLILLLAALLMLRANPKPPKTEKAKKAEPASAEPAAAEPAAAEPAENSKPAEKPEPAPAVTPKRVFCTNCGEPADAGTKFCTKCGTPLMTKEQTT